MIKADVICHYLEHSTRESFASEKAREAAENKGKGGAKKDDSRLVLPPWAQFRQGGGA